MPQLDPTWFASQLFWLAICFVALYFMLSRLILPPLLDIMAKRTESLASDVDTAQRLKTEAEQARLDYEKTLTLARNNAQTVMNEALAEQKAKAEAKGKELDKQIERKLGEAATRIGAQKIQMMNDLSPAVMELTSLIVEKLTQSKPAGDKVETVLRAAAKGGK